jgi:hypothetical protein
MILDLVLSPDALKSKIISEKEGISQEEGWAAARKISAAK